MNYSFDINNDEHLKILFNSVFGHILNFEESNEFEEQVIQYLLECEFETSVV